MKGSVIKRVFASGIAVTMLISLLSGISVSAAGYGEQEYFMHMTDENSYRSEHYANEGIIKEQSDKEIEADGEEAVEEHTDFTAPLTGDAALTESDRARLGLNEDTYTDPSVKKRDNLYRAGTTNAVDASGVVQGSLGDNVTYSLDTTTGLVTVSGTGAMTDYQYVSDSPLAAYSDVIKRVVIEEGVTSVGTGAFGFCFGLTEVSLPNSLTTIGQWAFLGCVSLETIYIPAGVTSIGDYSMGFYCSNGTEGSCYAGGMDILGHSGSAAETYATNNSLDFVAMDSVANTCGEHVTWSFDAGTGKLTITGTGAMTDYGPYSNRPAFEIYRSRIKTIVIGEGVTTVGDHAFLEYRNLESVTLASTITRIGIGSFEMDAKLAKVNFPTALTSIDEEAFYGCSSITQVTVPKNVTNIGSKAFSLCSNLESIKVDEDNAYFFSDGGVLLNADKTDLEIFPAGYKGHTYVAQNGLDRIESGCFSELSNLKYLVIKGEAPVMGRTQNMNGLTIYYDSSDADWTNIQNTFSAQDINWIDLKAFVDASTLSISAASNQLEMGQSMQLYAAINPSLATDFIWTSSDEKVAVISNTGRLIAVNPGSVVITVKSSDNRYTAKATFTIKGDKFSMPDYDYTTLDAEVLQYTSAITVTKQIISDKLHGIYFLNDKELCFYSFVNKSNTLVHKFAECEDAFVADDKLYVIGNNTCYIYDLNTQSMLKHFKLDGLYATAVGVDQSGRIYVAGDDILNRNIHKVRLYSDSCKQLSELIMGCPVYAFSGFDSTNGCFYMESIYNYYSWGYNHPGYGLTMGKVTGNTMKYIETFYGFAEGMISRSMWCLWYLCQTNHMLHQTSTDVLGGKYVIATSAFHGSVAVFDWDSANNNIERRMIIPRSALEEGENAESWDLSSIGTRSVYNERNNSIIIYENNKTISEYSLSTGDKIATISTKHNVFNLLKQGDSVVAIEKNGDEFYIEVLDWSEPKELTIQTDSLIMQVGDIQHLTMDSDAAYTVFGEWSSSDENVVSVTSEGKIAAWKEGIATITAKISDSTSASITITVVASETVTPASNMVVLEGADTYNASENHYSVWSKVVKSYLMENENGTFTKVESLGTKGVKVDTYSKDLVLLDSKTLTAELGLFGGFYSGKDANFLVFGQKNDSQTDDVEVLRIVKYSKKWERQGAVSVKGANTYIPFDAGSLRMTETGGKLYIHTCHTMYVSSDGLNHQANMTFVVDEANMTILDSYYDVMNIAQAGYVSHSFNQFVKTDGQYVYRVDHGDMHPRAMSITRCEVDGDVEKVRYTLPLEMQYYASYNNTGASIGGFELSSDNCLIAGCSVDQSDEDNFDVYGQRNIFVAVADKEMSTSKVVWLTEYASNYGKTVCTPHMVKLNDEQFLVMWEECDNKTGTMVVKMVTIDANGQMRSDIKEVNWALSDCAPIYSSDGLVRWYVTDGKKTMFFVINPYNLAAASGNIMIEEPSYDCGDEDGADGSGLTGEKFVDIRTEEIYLVTGENEVQYESCGYVTGDVVIEDSIVIGGVTYKVTSIAAKAFKNNTRITSVTIGDYVKTIGNEAFSGCSKLKKVVLGKNLTTIGKKAFYKCIALTKITIPSQVKTIGAQAFSGCKKLKTVTIGKRVVTIGASAFESCTKLTTVKGGASVQTIGQKAFKKCVALKKITLQTKVKKIGTQAFCDCKNLKTITIKSKQLKSVGKNAIKNIKKNATIKVPKAKKKAYKKLFKSKTGYKKSMKVK